MLARVIHDPDGGWSFATAREAASFGAGELTSVPGVEHAMAESGTLCGIPEHQVTRYMHLFEPAEPQACPECRQRAEAAPTKPCAQERLHDRLQAADPGQGRDDLLAALRRGVKVGLWLRGPAATLARHYADLDSLTEGAEPAIEAFNTTTNLGLARVEDGAWRFIAVLPEDDGRPLVARGPRTLS
ncbi:hypothetical protein AW27_010335 [Streptomyces sp. PCS3-D2]|uniref:hypothetical protein n=1 Tax=Streptomyces sp. PCS3-D2 TaxID=1460244 RepID=UPI00272D69D8|nr:hypothetical protein [Streptomyces sp. PCS3-D2]WKV71880.1 hypothetical protein AW27_010335 [Streptomyces sp. PCS3-D2]